MMQTREFYTARQLAERLDVKPQTLAIWRMKGEGPTFLKVGRAVRYRAADVDFWLEGREATNTAAARAQ